MLRMTNVESYYGRIRALHGVSLEAEEKRIVTILGANGAGKSTVLKTAAGLLDDQPDKGAIEFMGKRAEKFDAPRMVREGMSYVPEGRKIFAELTVHENLLMGAYQRRDSGGIRKDMDRVCELFPILKDRRSQLAGTLSGGEQQMLAIGRGLMSRPRMLLLDEPSLGLAPIVAREIFSIIRSINADGVTILLVEQNARAALAVADHGYVLENGRMVMDDKAASLMENEDIQEFYLGIRKEAGVRGEKRYKRKKRWR